MSGKSNIEWTEQTWNPIVGCSIVSPGCTNCYAMKMASRIEAMGNQPRYAGTTKKVKGNAVWTGKLSQAPDSTLLEPLKRKKPTTYFVNSMGDLFHEDCPDEWIDRVFAVMALAPQHTFQVLTKRAARMRDYCSAHDIGGRWAIEVSGTDGKTFPTVGTAIQWSHHGLPNVWLGVSTERQQEVDERIPLLLQTPAAVRFISAEPLLGAIDLTRFVDPISLHCIAGHESRYVLASELSYLQSPGENIVSVICPKCGADAAAGNDVKLDWVIVGGESGPGARPMHPEWARSLRNQCAAAGVAFFFKQWGEYLSAEFIPEGQIPNHCFIVKYDGMPGLCRVGKKAAGRLLDGIEHNAMPHQVPR